MYKGEDVKAIELSELLRKMGSRKVYIAQDEAGNTFGSIARSTITFTRNAVLIYPDKCNQYMDDAEGKEYHIADMK